MTLMQKTTTGETELDRLCSRPVAGMLQSADASEAASPLVWQLPEEAPVAVLINSQSYAVMMATPADLRDFAIGFLVSEGVLKRVEGVRGVLAMPVENGVAVDVAVAEDAIDASRLTRRTIEGRSGCGLCGVEDIAAAVRPLPRLARDWSPSAGAILKAAGALKAAQPMNSRNRSVHAAAWVSRTGDIRLVSEDVGRHNALDKLIGALIAAGADASDGFVLMTSRCSFELVQKAATCGIGALVTVSAPTTLAFDLAVSSNLFLAALAGADSVAIFNP